MIDYEPGTCALGFIWRCHGSVFPQALMWAFPSCLAALATLAILKEVDHEFPDGVVQNISSLWSSFQFMLGFLVVFRTQQAYVRYMEGACLLRQTRAEWFNAVSGLIAFSSKNKEKRERVEQFQHLVIRLMSLLSCCTLQSMADLEDDVMPIISLHGVDTKSMDFLISKEQKCHRAEIVIQWVQQLVVKESAAGVLDVAPPILSRFFEELRTGAVCAAKARNLTDIPFPFPYAQMLTMMLVVHAMLTPVMAAVLTRSFAWSAAISFVSVLSFWGTNYIAVQIESPFGDDPNDLPLVNIQQDINASLWILLEKQSQDVPAFAFKKEIHRKWRVQMERSGSLDQIMAAKSSGLLGGGVNRQAKVKMNDQPLFSSAFTQRDIQDLGDARGTSLAIHASASGESSYSVPSHAFEDVPNPSIRSSTWKNIISKGSAVAILSRGTRRKTRRKTAFSMGNVILQDMKDLTGFDDDDEHMSTIPSTMPSMASANCEKDNAGKDVEPSVRFKEEGNAERDAAPGDHAPAEEPRTPTKSALRPQPPPSSAFFKSSRMVDV